MINATVFTDILPQLCFSYFVTWVIKELSEKNRKIKLNTSFYQDL